MKKINLIEMLQGCSKRNGTAVYASNPDGQPTVNRRSKLTSYRGWCKKLTMIFAVLVLSIGQMWGATHTVTPNIGGTQYEIYNIYSNSSAYAFFSSATTIRSAYSSWVSGQLSSKSDAGATAVSGWLATGSGKPGYGKGFVNNSKTVTMTVTNCIEVAFVSKSGGSRTSNLSVKLNGVEVGSVATNGNSYAAVTYGTALDASKTYTITLSGSNSSNCEVDQIRFKAPAVCSAALGGTTSNPSATVGESAGTISCTVNNGAAKTATSYQWYKNTSKSTSGATSISGATSSTYSPNEASAGTYYYYCTVQTAQITTAGADAARITSGISDAFVFASDAPTCVAPTSVTVTPTNTTGWRYSTGETIDLTCTATGGTGTKTYQWQKYIGSTWTDINTATNASAGTARLQIANCTSSDGGNYRCVVSTGATCSLESDGYWVRVFTLNGNYYGSAWTENPIVWTGEYTGVATVNLNASSTYMFKVTDNDGKWFGYTANNFIIQPQARDCGTGNSDIRLFTGPAGNYTFTINIQHAAELSPYVNISVGYPEVTHPNSGYMYITKWWDCYIHYWEGTNNALTAWGSDPKINSDRYVEICGTNYWYFPVIATYNKFIAKDATGDAGNTTGDQVSTANGGKYITNDGSWGWHDFSTYSISFDAGGGTGTMSAIEGLCPNSNQALPANTFEKTGYTFSCWHADKATKVGGSAVAIGGDIAGGATLQEINNNITLTAQWTAVKVSSITVAPSSKTLQVGGTQQLAATVSPNNALDKTVTWSTSNGSVATVSNTGLVAAVAAGTCTITATANDGSGKTGTCSITVEAAAAGNEVAATWPMVSGSSLTLVGSADHASVTPSNAVKAGTNISNLTDVVDASFTDYTGKMAKVTASGTIGESNAVTNDHYLKYTLTVASGYKFTPTGFSATVARFGTDNAYAQVVLKQGATTIKATDASKPNRSGKGAAKTVYSAEFDDASTYSAGTSIDLYIYLGGGMASTKYYGVLAVSITGTYESAACSTPAAPTGFTAGSITSTGATFSITDGGDAASYDIFYSTSSTAPTSGTAATTTSDSKTKAVTGLTANTTYYAWVRSVCDASHKSAWVALSGSSFKTSAAAASQTALVINTLYKVPDMIPSGATLTDDDQFFEGLSANNKFQLIGSASGSTTPKANSKSTNDKTIDGITFDDGSMWFKGTASLTSNIPTTYGLSFIVPEGGGKLYLYFSGTSTNIKLAKSGASGSKPSCASGYGEVDVTAGTYYLYGTGTTAPYSFYGLKLCSTYSVSITTNSTTKTSGETGSTAAVNGKAYTATFTANTGYTLPSDVTVTIGGAAQTKGTGYTWTVSSGTGTLTVPAAKVTGNIVVTVTGTAAATYSLTYNCNGAESGCPSNTTASALPNPLPSAPTKDGYTFGGWFTDEDLTVAAVAGAAMTGATTLYAKWTVNSSSECITITNFATSNVNNTCGDGNGKIFYGYKGSVSDANALTITSNDGNDRGQNSGAEMRLTYNKLMRIYANNTTNAAPATFSNVTSVSFKWKFIASGNSGNTELTSSYTVKVGSTTIANAVSITGKTKDGYQTVTIDNLAQLSGYVEIKFGGSSSSYNVYLDDIEICTASMASCTTPTLPTLSNQSLCEGADIAAWNATPTNASTITGKGESISYSWKKKGNATELANTATFDLGSSAAESQGGTYVVTVTVSKDGYASSTATKEVTLSVTDGVEVTAITADKATVYPTNSVTLTATASASATWQWYTCTNSDGTGESSISGATNASYTIASAPAAGTYYYKVKATSSCGNAERVYTLTVSAAAGGDCFHYVSVLPDKDISPSSGASIVTPTYATTLEGGTMKVGSQQITITKNGLKLESSKSVSITLDAALAAGNVVIVKGTSATAGYGVTINGVNFYDADSKTFDVSYTVAAGDGLVGKTALTVSKYSGSSYLQEIKITGCGEACTDPEVTAKVNGASSATLCSGEASFTATDAHASATYRWQRYSGSTWTDISGATNATYTIASVTEGDEGKYRVIATHECARTSNEVTLNVSATPVFGSLGGAREVETGGSLSITNVEASDATSYKWYRSSNNTYEAGTDTQVGTAKNLLLPVNDAAGTTFYLFCVATNTCGNVTSDAITVSVIAAAEKDCAVAASNGENFTTAKTSSVSSGTYNGQTELHMNSNNKYIYYIAATGYHFETATVNCCAGDATALTQAAYSYSTNGGETWTDADLPGAMTNQYSNHVVNLPADVNAFRVGRVLGDHGVGSNTLYVHEVCFTYVADCNATTIAISNATPSYDLSVGGDFTEPTCTVKQGSTALSPQPALRYSSFNEAVATVDPSTGEVDFTGTAGSVVIMASYDGDEDYCASSATYTITVSCGDEDAPKIVAGSGTNLSGCNASVSLAVKDQSGNNFASGSYQWYRDGEEIDGATSATYTAERTGTYTVSHTGECTQMSTNSAVVTSESFDPSVERLVPFQYYHADKTYTAQMKDRHLFAVTSGGDYEGKRYYMTATRNGDPLDISASTAFFVRTSIDNRVDTVMIDLNRLNGKFNAGDEIVLTCAAIADCGTISAVTEDIEIHVIDNTPTLALICSGTNKSAGTRKTSELTVGGDFLTGYNVADLCQQTGNTSFDANTEWGLYTRLKENYIVTPVNGYAVFNKLNYEPFDILLLTDYPKASKDDAAATVLDDMADLCDYRPMLSFKAHMVSKTPSKWAAKGFTTSPVVPKNTRTRLNIVCYAHPMFATLKSTATHIQKDNDDPSQIVYTMLTGAGYESSKGLQGFELAAAENFVTIGLVHYNATPADGSPSAGLVTWTPGSEDRMLVTAVERQENLEARMIMFAVNCGAQSKFTETGRNVVLKCLEYLLDDNPLHVADCSFTFDNGAGNSRDADKQAEDCPSCTGTKGDGKWSTAANWGPDYVVRPGKDTEVKIAAPVTVDPAVGTGAASNFTPKVRSVRILEGGQVTIPAGSYLEVVSTIRRQDGNDIYPTEANDIVIGSSAEGNGTLIFNNSSGDTKARVDMYSTAKADMETMSAATSKWQYIGTPHSDVVSATRNYYDSWLYQYDTGSQGWTVIPNGGPLEPFRGYCVTHPAAPVVFDMEGTLVATTSADIDVPANKYVVAANSWVAPIDINAITDDDMENISDKAIYFFNTGSDVNGTGTLNGGDRWAAGTYVSVPIHSAPYTGDDHIPSMQGFYVWSTTAGTLHLDYDRHVRGTSRTNKISGRMHAPKRVQTGDNEPNVLKIFARGNRYDDRLVVLEREDFTRRYESGWDGEAWGGSDLSPMVYITNEAGVDEAVSAIPEFEGTVITFRAGEDSEYRFEFTYSGETDPLYLYDMDNNTYTQIMTGNAYYFTTSDKAPHSRFILTRKAPQIATGTELTSDGEGANAKKLLIEDKMYILLNGMLYDATGKVVK